MTPSFVRRSLSRAILGAFAVLLSTTTTAADPYPTKPIRVLVPYAAGGTTDQIARVLQPSLSESLGQQLLIDNKPGAGGTIGTEMAVNSPPDGYTLDFGNNGPNALIQLMRPIPYDPIKDLRPVALVALTPMFFAVPGDSPAKTLKEFIAYAKQNDGKLNIGSVGNGSFSHVTAEYFKQLAGLNLTHIPYNGGAPMMTAFAGGQIQAGFVTGVDGAALQRAGKIRYLAIATPQPSAVAPGMPTVAEVLPGFRSYSWFAIFAPKGTPDDIVAKLNAAIAAAVARPEVQKFFADRNVEAKSSTPDGLARLIQEDIAQWGPVIKKANIQM
ncbi:MAG: tripartite tricarboxylate transporter substrate binding protein [Caldimonas sp.]